MQAGVSGAGGFNRVLVVQQVRGPQLRPEDEEESAMGSQPRAWRKESLRAGQAREGFLQEFLSKWGLGVSGLAWRKQRVQAGRQDGIWGPVAVWVLQA